MPKLRMLVACEKVIMDATSQVPSLIGIFQGMNVPITDAPLPENPVSPIKWAFFTIWQHTPDEKGTEYIQRMEVITPSGIPFGKGEARFKVDDDLQSKTSTDLFGLPIGEEGNITIRVWLEGIENASGEYQFWIKHIRSTKNANPGATISGSIG